MQVLVVSGRFILILFALLSGTIPLLLLLGEKAAAVDTHSTDNARSTNNWEDADFFMLEKWNVFSVLSLFCLLVVDAIADWL
jgi:hypothetical protein